jgi:hypothetical protein
MPTPNFPEWMDDPLFRRLAELEQRVHALEHRDPLGSAAIVNGALQVLDRLDFDTYVVRARFGQLPSGGFGVEMYDEDGNNTFAVRDDGLARPTQPLTAFWSDDFVNFVTRTDAAFTTLGTAYVQMMQFSGLYVQWHVGTDVGTTAELRVQITAWDGTTNTTVTSSVKTVPSGTGGGGGGTGPHVLKWAHGLPRGQNNATQRVAVQLQARRASGAGNYYAVRPAQIELGDATELGATAMGGTWS